METSIETELIADDLADDLSYVDGKTLYIWYWRRIAHHASPAHCGRRRGAVVAQCIVSAVVPSQAGALPRSISGRRFSGHRRAIAGRASQSIVGSTRRGR